MSPITPDKMRISSNLLNKAMKVVQLLVTLLTTILISYHEVNCRDGNGLKSEAQNFNCCSGVMKMTDFNGFWLIVDFWNQGSECFAGKSTEYVAERPGSERVTDLKWEVITGSEVNRKAVKLLRGNYDGKDLHYRWRHRRFGNVDVILIKYWDNSELNNNELLRNESNDNVAYWAVNRYRNNEGTSNNELGGDREAVGYEQIASNRRSVSGAPNRRIVYLMKYRIRGNSLCSSNSCTYSRKRFISWVKSMGYLPIN